MLKFVKTKTFPLQTLDKRMMAVVVLWEINKYFTESTFLVEYFRNVFIFANITGNRNYGN